MKGRDKDALLVRILHPLKQVGSVRVSKKDRFSKVLRDVQARHAKIFTKDDLRDMRAVYGGKILGLDDRVDSVFPTASGDNLLTVVKGLSDDVPNCPVHSLPFIFYSKKHSYMLCNSCLEKDHAGVTHHSPDTESYVITPGELPEARRIAALQHARRISDKIGEERALEDLSFLIDTLNNGGTKPVRKGYKEVVADIKAFERERVVETSRRPSSDRPGAHEDVVTFIKRVLEDPEFDPTTLAFGEEELAQRNYLGRTPLMSAVCEGRNDVVKILLNNGANPDHLSTYSSERHRVLSGIASGAGARFDCSKRSGENHCFAGDIAGGGITPLVAAAAEGNLGAVKLLVGYGADVNFREPSSGMTALCASVASHVEMSVDIAEVLIVHGGSVNTQLNHGSTALDLAILFHHPNVFDKILDTAGTLPPQAFPDDAPHGSFFLVADKDDRVALTPSRSYTGGFTSLLVSVQLGRAYMAERLLNLGADVSCRDKLGATVLMHSATWKDVFSVVLLHGASAADAEGRDVLHKGLHGLPGYGYPLEWVLRASRQSIFQGVGFSETQRDAWLGRATSPAAATPSRSGDGNGAPEYHTACYDALACAVEAGQLEHTKFLLAIHKTYWDRRAEQSGGEAAEQRFMQYPCVSWRHTLRTAFLTAVLFCRARIAEAVLECILEEEGNGARSAREVLGFTPEDLQNVCGGVPGEDTLCDVVLHRSSKVPAAPQSRPILKLLLKHKLFDITGCDSQPRRLPSLALKGESQLHRIAPHFFFLGKHNLDSATLNCDCEVKLGDTLVEIYKEGDSLRPVWELLAPKSSADAGDAAVGGKGKPEIPENAPPPHHTCTPGKAEGCPQAGMPAAQEPLAVCSCKNGAHRHRHQQQHSHGGSGSLLGQQSDSLTSQASSTQESGSGASGGGRSPTHLANGRIEFGYSPSEPGGGGKPVSGSPSLPRCIVAAAEALQLSTDVPNPERKAGALVDAARHTLIKAAIKGSIEAFETIKDIASTMHQANGASTGGGGADTPLTFLQLLHLAICCLIELCVTGSEDTSLPPSPQNIKGDTSRTLGSQGTQGADVLSLSGGLSIVPGDGKASNAYSGPMTPVGRSVKAAVLIELCLKTQGISTTQPVVPSPLACAAASRNPLLVRKLLEVGWNPFTFDSFGRLPISYASDELCAKRLRLASVQEICGEDLPYPCGARPGAGPDAPGLPAPFADASSPGVLRQLYSEKDVRGESTVFRSLALDDQRTREVVLMESRGDTWFDPFETNANGDTFLHCMLQHHAAVVRRAGVYQASLCPAHACCAQPPLGGLTFLSQGTAEHVASTVMRMFNKMDAQGKARFNRLKANFLFTPDSQGYSALDYLCETADDEALQPLAKVFPLTDAGAQASPTRRLALLTALVRCLQCCPSSASHGKAIGFVSQLMPPIVGVLPEGSTSESALSGDEELRLYREALSLCFRANNEALLRAVHRSHHVTGDEAIVNIVKHDAHRVLAAVSREDPRVFARPLNVAPHTGDDYTLAHWCVVYTAPRCCQEASRFDPMTLCRADANGSFPLHLAAEKGSLAMVKALVDHNADVSQTRKKDGATPAAAACLARHPNCAQYLLNGKSRSAYPSYASSGQIDVFNLAILLGLEDVALAVSTYKSHES
eukprot:TRINITY_DN15021_c0_g1_i1.p1 TRINITY_DN15021_c0_g1~~TRINITY_DN15021_c0_g1_i1.p1  ORF type:complete len:1638 (+),score=510.93 TRINITY_DN15021_c0_g1_i1:43-4956(+)